MTRTWKSPAETVAERIFAAAAATLIAFLAGQLLLFEYGRDQGIYAVVASEMLHGGAPYRDAWDFKTPGIYFVFALSRALFGPPMWGVRVLEVAALAAAAVAFARLSKRHCNALGAAVPATVVLFLVSIQLEFWNTAQPESFAVAALAWALVFAEDPRAPNGRGWRPAPAWIASGACYAIAGLLKPPLGGGILVSCGFAIARCRNANGGDRWRAAWNPLSGYAIGGAIPLAVTLAYLAGSGAFSDFIDALFVFTPNYTAVGAEHFWRLIPISARMTFAGLSPYLAIGWLALLLMPRLAPREREGWAHILGVIALVLIGVALQAKLFPYHFAPALGLAALPAGWGYWKLWIRARRSVWGVLAAIGLTVALALDAVPGLPDKAGFWTRCAQRVHALTDPTHSETIRNDLYSTRSVDAGSNRRAARWIREHTRPEDRIYVWGFEPILYDLAGRRPASRYIYNVPQRVDWGREAARKKLVAELDRQPPAVFVVEHRDYMPPVTGNRHDSAEMLEDFPALSGRLRERYVLAETIGNLDLYLPRDRADDPR